MSRPVAVVTGASRGIGRAIAEALRGRGARVIGHSSLHEDADTIAADLSHPPAPQVLWELALERAGGRIDAVVNNAGIGIDAPFVKTTEGDFDRLMNIHLKGVFFLTQTLLPLISDGGRIINLSTGLTRFSLPGFSAYSMMKGAIEVLTRYLAKELGPRGISVNTIAPGAIETDFAGGSVRDNKQINGFIAGVTALGRVGLPDDIGPAVAALLSDDNHWINAQRIEVSGGMFA